MKRWLTHLTIVAYLVTLSWGVFAHAFHYGTTAHPGMYFLVWDMFCGWSGYSQRYHIIGEGESGRFYELAPGPWGEIKPYGDLDRRHYDNLGNGAYRIARNTLRHTEHEPMTRIFLVEETWNKKYNLPDRLWDKRYEAPKDPRHYYHVRSVFSADGMVLRSNGTWIVEQRNRCIAANPRLQADARKGRPFFTANSGDGPSRGAYVSGSRFAQQPQSPIGSPLGD